MLLLVICLGLCVFPSLALNTYFLTSPSTIVKGEKFTVGVHILNTNTTANERSRTSPMVRIRAQLVEVIVNGSKIRRNVMDGDRRDFVQGVPGTLQLKLPLNALKTSSYRLKIRAKNGLQFETERVLTVHSQRASTLIQTDKAMYKGGQIVNFRVITIYPNLRPFKGEVNIDIKDRKGNRMKQWLNLSQPKGVITESFQLSDEPTNGQWSITVTIPSLDDYKSSRSFEVQQYELPKFEVKVELAPYGLYSDLEVHGTVKADYTFGKAVEGMVDLRAFSGNIRNQCGVEESSVQQVFPISGESKFVFSVTDIKKTRGNYWGNLQNVQIVARVTEKVTGKVLNGTGTIKFFDKPHKLAFLPTSVSTFKPGLPYTAYVKVTTQDDLPITANRQRIQVYTCVDFARQSADQRKYACHQFQGTYNLPTMSLMPSEAGIAEIIINEVPRNTTRIKIKAWYGDISVEKTVNNAFSPSNSFIKISTFTHDETKKIDQTINFEIRSTEPVGKLNYLIKARGSIEAVQTHDMENSLYTSMYLPVTPNMSPSAYILVYYIRDNGEVVADGLTFSVDRLFKHNVSVEYNQKKASPDDTISLIVSGQPRSQAFVLAVDQSVLLLKSGNDLTQDKVKKEMESFSNVPNPIKLQNWRYGHQSSGTRPNQFFTEAGVIVISDIPMFSNKPMGGRRMYNKGSSGRHQGPPGMYEEAPIQFNRVSYSPTSLDAGTLPDLLSPDRVRNIFPETWLWANETVRSDGKVSFTAKVPDTITSWVASAFGVDNSLGLGVAAITSKLLVEKTFFISLNMPSSVKYGEVVTLQAIVFNYLQQDIPVTVSLPKSDSYTNIEISPNGDESDISEDQSSTVIIPSGTPTSVYFPIRPRKRGNIDIEVTAKSFLAADAVRRQLMVTPEGIRREKNVNVLIQTTFAEDFRHQFTLNPPSGLVPDTMKIKITATGDLMRLSLDNLQNLIHLPTGCGEQNLMKFVPNVFIADYLTSTNQLSDSKRQQIIRNLELGYQKQLTYQRYDWSYSPFGDSDGAGSSWLTSFVVRSFQQAKKYIYIDDIKTAESVRWILDRQTRDGSFTEQGTIIDQYLQKNPVSLTAYVLLSLLEIDTKIFGSNDKMKSVLEYGNVTEKAISYLELKVQNTDDVYSLAIATLALTKAESGQAEAAFQKVKSKLSSIDDTRYLQVKPVTGTNPLRSYHATTHDIIATSYVLLTYVARGEVKEGYDIMKFLVSRRNKNGGFQSSQDTVVALEALSKYASASRPKQFNVEITLETDQAEGAIFNVNSNNALVLQSKQLINGAHELTISARGEGVAYIDVSTEFYVTGVDKNDNFDISTVLLDDNLNGFTLMTCCKVLNGEPTGMATATLQIPAGFNPDLSSINVAGVRKVEKRGSDVNIYFDQIGKTSTCVSLQASRSSMVSGTQECYVQLTDYYKPSKSTTVSYLPRKLKESTVCDVCPACC